MNPLRPCLLAIAALALAAFAQEEDNPSDGAPPPAIEKMIDPRDGQSYPTVKIGNQTWMARNLNYPTSNALCYDNDSGHCAKYGRLYDWSTAKQACPEGWHLPTNPEWDMLINAVGVAIAGSELKSASGWTDGTDDANGFTWNAALESIPDRNGSNSFGFTALPAGIHQSDSTAFHRAGVFAFFWTSSQDSFGNAIGRAIASRHSRVDLFGDYTKKPGCSVRCLKDFSTTAKANPLDSWKVFNCSDSTGLAAGIWGRPKVFRWCPVCEDTFGTPRLLDVQSLQFDHRGADKCSMKLNGTAANPAMIYVYRSDSVWANLEDLALEFQGKSITFLRKSIPLYFHAPGNPSLMRSRFSLKLPHGEVLYSVYGGIMFNDPRTGLYVDNFKLYRTDFTGTNTGFPESPPSLVASFHDSVTGNMYVVVEREYGTMGNICCNGNLAVFQASKDGIVRPLGDIENTACSSESGWQIDSIHGGGDLVGVLIISEKSRPMRNVKSAPRFTYVIGPQGITKVPAIDKKQKKPSKKSR